VRWLEIFRLRAVEEDDEPRRRRFQSRMTHIWMRPEQCREAINLRAIQLPERGIEVSGSWGLPPTRADQDRSERAVSVRLPTDTRHEEERVLGELLHRGAHMLRGARSISLFSARR
jgi:hypothetical protein